MILIKKDSINKIVLTLNEMSRLDNPYYLFVFENEYDLEENPIYFTTEDLSSSVNRYNLFSINESSNGSKTGGIDVDLNLVIGQYKYKVYESETQTIDIDDTTGRLIESGRMVVVGEDVINYDDPDNFYK